MRVDTAMVGYRAKRRDIGVKNAVSGWEKWLRGDRKLDGVALETPESHTE